MLKVDDETLRQRFLKAKEAWDERQKENRTKQRREKAHADAKRKTISGEMVLHHVQENPHEHERLMTRLDVISRPQGPRPFRPATHATQSRNVRSPCLRRPAVPRRFVTHRPLSGLPSAARFDTIPPSSFPFCCVRLTLRLDTAGAYPHVHGSLAHERAAKRHGFSARHLVRQIGSRPRTAAPARRAALPRRARRPAPHGRQLSPRLP